MTETERVKPRAMSVEEAIALALESRWTEAVAVNRRLIDQHGPDEDAHNRLGKALSELGELDEALASYRSTLELNPLNLIAPKMVRKLQAQLEAPSKLEGSNAAIDVDVFTEEPGRSALTVVPTPPEVSAALAPGDVVELHVGGTALRARTARGVEVGDLDVKLARRLIPLIQTGNRYSAAVARVGEGAVELMLREAHQAPENARKTSFPIARGPRRDDFRPYAKESILATREEDEVEVDEDEAAEASGPLDSSDLEGMQTVEGDLDAGAATLADDDDVDDDSRPEDEY